MIYIDWVKSNMKGGCDVKLGARTVIVGDNGSGKSTIVQSAELATRGVVSDMEGREQVKQHTALARLFPEDVDLVAECGLSNGATFSWRMERKAKEGFKQPVAGASDGRHFRWPVQELKAILASDATAVATWLEGLVVGPITEADLLSPLDPDMRESVSALVKATGITDFMKLAKAAKDTARTLRAGATRTEKTVDAMVEGVSPPMLDETRQALQDQLAALTPVAGSVSQQEVGYVNQQLEQLVTEYKGRVAELEALPAVDPTTLSVVQRVRGARSLIEQHQTLFGAPADSCWVCGSATAVPNAHAQNIEGAAAHLQALMQQHHRRESLVSSLGVAESRLTQLVARRDSMVVAPDTSVERDALLRQLAGDDAAQRTWRNAKAQRGTIEQDRARAEQLTKASKALAVAGKEMLESKKQMFVDKVSAYLPPGEELGVDLDSARVGLMRDGQLHSALSGAEWSRLMLALASVWVDDSTPCALVPEDRAWDADTLTRVMESLSTSPVQVVIMSTVRPGQVEGWQIVNV